MTKEKGWQPHDKAPPQPGEPNGFPAGDPFEPHQHEDDLARESGDVGRRQDPRRNTGRLPDPKDTERQ